MNPVRAFALHCQTEGSWPRASLVSHFGVVLVSKGRGSVLMVAVFLSSRSAGVGIVRVHAFAQL